MILKYFVLAFCLLNLSSSLMAGTAEQCWKTLCTNRFVLTDLPGKPEELTPVNPQTIVVSDDAQRTYFQDYTVYAARVKEVIVVALFDPSGTLLDYSIRRPPEGVEDFSLKLSKRKNEAELIWSFANKEQRAANWTVRFQRPELNW